MRCYLFVFFAMALKFFSCQTQGDQKNNRSRIDPLDISSQDSSVRPQSDFYLFANGTCKEIQTTCNEYLTSTMGTLLSTHPPEWRTDGRREYCR